MITENLTEEHSSELDDRTSDENNPWARYIKRANRFPTAKRLDKPFSEVLDRALEQSKYIDMDYGVLGGSPRIAGTRIPLYMILDAIEYHGNLEGAINSYPELTMAQVRDALLFAAAVLECPCGK